MNPEELSEFDKSVKLVGNIMSEAMPDEKLLIEFSKALFSKTEILPKLWGRMFKYLIGQKFTREESMDLLKIYINREN